MKGAEHKVYKLQKTLYGLRQAPRAWNKHIDSMLLMQGFHKCSVEYDIYVRETNQKLLIVCLYVDDLIVTGDEEAEIEEFKESMKVVFEMTDLGIIHYFLGLEVVHTQSGILLHQNKYILEVLKKFNMADCNPVPTSVMANLKLTEALEEGVVVLRFKSSWLVHSYMYITTGLTLVMDLVLWADS